MPVLFDDGQRFDATVPVLVVGAGACGLTAALAARDAGAEVLVIERDAMPEPKRCESAQNSVPRIQTGET